MPFKPFVDILLDKSDLRGGCSDERDLAALGLLIDSIRMNPEEPGDLLFLTSAVAAKLDVLCSTSLQLFLYHLNAAIY